MWDSDYGLFELVLMVMCGNKTLSDKTNANAELKCLISCPLNHYPALVGRDAYFSHVAVSGLPLRLAPHIAVKH